ncbi:MAG: D-aminoacyl-tRNA deacylase [Fimbriimonadales bacterium]|nr:D-aminoacyl-tRNA deacylase [Fimbriimonadales bacterium]
MRAVIQRVKWAEVEVNEQIVGRVEQGALILLGVHASDTAEQARWLAHKIAQLRFFEDETGKLNRSVLDIGGAMLVVSNFTLYGDCRKGRRPSFTESAPYEPGRALYEQFCAFLQAEGVPVQTGVYGAEMQVRLQNDGPVTLIVDTQGAL